MFRKITSMLIVFALCFTVMAAPVSAKERVFVGSNAEVVTLYDAQLGKNVDVGIQSTRISRNKFEYNFYTDGKWESTVYVDLDNDYAYLYDGDTKVEYVVSETVTLEKIPDNNVPVIDTLDTIPARATGDFLNNEPLRISSGGQQIPLGTSKYDGYEAVGSLSFSNPSESGYLQRKAAGYTTFDSYKFTINESVAFDTAASVIISLLIAAGMITPPSAMIISSLLSGILSGTVSYIKAGFSAYLRCREYKWDYRVRHNSNTGTILKTVSKYRYWWEMYDQRGNRSFEERNDLANGWVLSNHDLIATALGRY